MPSAPSPPPSSFVYLASQSPRRAQLLDQLGVAHRPLAPDADEHAEAEALEAEREGETPLAYVERVAMAKLGAARERLARRRLPEAPILCADTTVALGNRILGKPVDDDAALATLRALSGRSHRVLTAVAVAAGARTWLKTSVSEVRFAAIGDDALRRYVASGEPRGKAGAYAVQGPIAAYVERIAGSHSGVVGLPLFEAAELLARARVAMAV